MKENDKKLMQRFSNLKFENFKSLAKEGNLSKYEKIGFLNNVRDGFEFIIFNDIWNKLQLFNTKGKTILDIGPGCSDLPSYIIENCRDNNHKLILIDSKEMLDLLPDEKFITKIPAFYPDAPDFILEYKSKVDAIICYSVFHYIFVEANIYQFLDKSLSLLNSGGRFLIGDIPNVSKRKRFFSSEAGIAYHKKFTSSEEDPKVVYNMVEEEKIDDGVILGLMLRCRSFGFDSYLLPQAVELPMSNRREDLLIYKP